jgi:hypothetical protein
VPADAEAVSADEFRRRQAAGELQVITPDAQQTQRSTRAQQVAADRAFLEAQTDLSAEVAALLAQARAANDLEGRAGRHPVQRSEGGIDRSGQPHREGGGRLPAGARSGQRAGLV